MLVQWVPVVLVDCLVNVGCLELLVSAVHVVVLALLALVVHVVLLENLVKWGPEVRMGHKERLDSVVHKDFKVQLVRWETKAKMESMARRDL